MTERKPRKKSAKPVAAALLPSVGAPAPQLAQAAAGFLPGPLSRTTLRARLALLTLATPPARLGRP